jgi:uncharacterized protein (UPF0210 family)
MCDPSVSIGAAGVPDSHDRDAMHACRKVCDIPLKHCHAGLCSRCMRGVDIVAIDGCDPKARLAQGIADSRQMPRVPPVTSAVRIMSFSL